MVSNPLVRRITREVAGNDDGGTGPGLRHWYTQQPRISGWTDTARGCPERTDALMLEQAGSTEHEACG